MSDRFSNEPMLDMFIFETTQNIEQLESIVLSNEKSDGFSTDAVNEIFRIMHTIKGSSSMMMFNNIASLTHIIEDVFYDIREFNPEHLDYTKLSDLVLRGVDFIKVELEKIKNSDDPDGEASELIEDVQKFIKTFEKKDINKGDTKKKIKEESSKQQQFYLTHDKDQESFNKFKSVLYFEDGCEMENIRAYTVIHNLKNMCSELIYEPEDIIDNEDTIEIIREKGFKILFKTNKDYDKIHKHFMDIIFLKDLILDEITDEYTLIDEDDKSKELKIEDDVKIPKNLASKIKKKSTEYAATQQSIISVHVDKLDSLMDLVGEMVIAEAMVTQNPDLDGLELENFEKSARQLGKITSELQDMVMSIRMVPLSMTFQRMHRIVRDMSRNLEKDVQLKLEGEGTEVDKNIIEHIADPLMHLVRNSIDHGIEDIETRKNSGKDSSATITLEAKNAGSDVVIVVKDDGRGLNKETIYKKAVERGLVDKPIDEMEDREIYNLILVAGFSTNDKATEYSGRGVGMDVVIKNLESVGGTVFIDSVEGIGTTTTMKIPLTLAIIDGMNIKVGKSRYTLPIVSIKESFRPNKKDIIQDNDGNEMVLVRGECHPIIRLHRLHEIDTEITTFDKGILIMIEQDNKSLCVFADELLGQQQVVVKNLPDYITNIKRIEVLSGCTLLGDGSISLILNVGGLVNMIA